MHKQIILDFIRVRDALEVLRVQEQNASMLYALLIGKQLPSEDFFRAMRAYPDQTEDESDRAINRVRHAVSVMVQNSKLADDALICFDRLDRVELRLIIEQQIERATRQPASHRGSVP